MVEDSGKSRNMRYRPLIQGVPDPQLKRQKWISETLLLTALPVLGYLFAFVYEAGQANAFGIPLEFVSIGLSNVFIAAGALVLIIPVILFLLGVRRFLLRGEVGMVRLQIINMIPYMIFFVVHLMIYRDRYREWIFSLGILLFAAFVEFVWPLIFHPDIRGYRNKVLADVEAETQHFDRLTKRLGLYASFHRVISVVLILSILWLYREPESICQ